MKHKINRPLWAVSIASALFIGGCTLEEAKDAATPPPTLAETKSAMTASQPAAAPPSDHPDHPGHENHAKDDHPDHPGHENHAKETGGAPAAPPMAGGPMMGMADPMAPLTPTPELDTAIKEAEKGGNKAKIGESYTKRGIFRMNDAKAGARLKYRAALSDLRKALAATPDNAQAKEAKAQIESIYTSMGRPVPTDDVP